MRISKKRMKSLESEIKALKKKWGRKYNGRLHCCHEGARALGLKDTEIDKMWKAVGLEPLFNMLFAAHTYAAGSGLWKKYEL